MNTVYTAFAYYPSPAHAQLVAQEVSLQGALSAVEEYVRPQLHAAWNPRFELREREDRPGFIVDLYIGDLVVEVGRLELYVKEAPPAQEYSYAIFDIPLVQHSKALVDEARESYHQLTRLLANGWDIIIKQQYVRDGDPYLHIYAIGPAQKG